MHQHGESGEFKRVMRLKRHHDLPAANQWAATVGDEHIRNRLLLLLEN